MTLSKNHEMIYNDYLKALAKANNRPYKFRKDFSNLGDDVKNTLYRLDLFFQTYKHIIPYNFFIALLEYKGLKFARLDDYLMHSAVIAYSKWNKVKYENFVEDEKTVDDFMQGLKFIYDYCNEENINLKKYRTKVNSLGVHQMLIHLNEQRISYYHLHALNMQVEDFDSDYLHITFNNFNEMFNLTRNQFNRTKIIKNISNKLTK